MRPDAPFIMRPNAPFILRPDVPFIMKPGAPFFMRPGASFTKGRRFRRRRRRKRRLYDKSYAHVRCVLRRGVSPLVTRAYT